MVQSKQQEAKLGTIYDPNYYEPSEQQDTSLDDRSSSSDIQVRNSYIYLDSDLHRSVTSAKSSSMSELERNIIGNMYRQH